MGGKQDLTGKRFGKLVVIKEFGRNKWKSVVWLCQCDCGNTNIVATKDLNAGAVKSCGCGSKNTLFQKKKHFGGNKYDLTSQEYGIGYYEDKQFFFDKEDYDLIKKYFWFVNNNDYVKASYLADGTKLDKTIRMHILVKNSDPEKYDVDHINHKITDNRKENLRVVLHNENLMNTKLYSNNTTGVKGVYWDKNRKKWMVCITAYKHTYHLGRFDNFDDAVRVRKEAELKYHGEYRNKELD